MVKKAPIKRTGVRRPQGRFISTLEEMEARDVRDVREGRVQVEEEEEDGEGRGTSGGISSSTVNNKSSNKNKIKEDRGSAEEMETDEEEAVFTISQPSDVYVKEKPLRVEEIIETANPNARNLNVQFIKAKDL